MRQTTHVYSWHQKFSPFCYKNLAPHHARRNIDPRSGMHCAASPPYTVQSLVTSPEADASGLIVSLNLMSSTVPIDSLLPKLSFLFTSSCIVCYYSQCEARHFSHLAVKHSAPPQSRRTLVLRIPHVTSPCAIDSSTTRLAYSLLALIHALTCFYRHVSIRKTQVAAKIFKHPIHAPCRPSKSSTTLPEAHLQDPIRTSGRSYCDHDDMPCAQSQTGTPPAAKCADACDIQGLPSCGIGLLWASLQGRDLGLLSQGLSSQPFL